MLKKRWPATLRLALIALVAWTPVAHAHGGAMADLGNPLARGLYVMLPIPYVLFGLIAWLLYRARHRQDAQTGDESHKPDNI